MSVLDTFDILFRFNSAQAKKEVDDIDGKLNELAKKGKKRSIEENKQYDELKKKRKEVIDQIVQQRNETEKLDDKFQSMITNAVGAVTAFATFQGLKSTLLDANKLNVALSNLALNYHINANELKAYGAALEQAGGSSQDLYSFVNAYYADLRQKRLPAVPLSTVLGKLNVLAQNPGLNDPALQALGTSGLSPLIRQSPAEFARLVEQGQKTATLQKEQEDAARKNNEAWAELGQQVDSVATEMNTALRPAIVGLADVLRSITETLRGHPIEAAVSSVATVLGVGVGTTLAAKGIWGALKGGAGLAGSGAGALLRNSPIALAGAGIAGGAWWLLGKEQDYINDKFGNKSAARPTGGVKSAANTNQQKIYNFWRDQGYSDSAARGWLANAQQESTFNPMAQNGSHFGIYQWDSARRQRILSGTGIDVANSGLEQQLHAAAWEAQHFYGLSPSAFSSSAAGSAGLISNRFEVPSLTAAGLAAEAQRRGALTGGYNSTAANYTPGTGGDKVINVKTGDIIVNTQATDASGIASAVSGQLQTQIRTTMANFDDGVNY